jgi:glycosyltransferase involved in cell wall biosynthesis
VRVVYVVPRAHPGPAERVVMDYVTFHDRSAVESSLLFLTDGPLVEEARALKVPVEVLPPAAARGLSRKAYRDVVATRIGMRGGEIVHGVTAAGHDIAGAAAKHLRLPAVWTQHELPSRTRWADYRTAFTSAERILVNSSLTARAQRRVNPRGVAIEVVRPGVRIPDEPREAVRARCRAALGIDQDAFVVAHLAPLAPGTGQATFLEAARSLCNARRESIVLLAGQPPRDGSAADTQAFQRLVAPLGIGSRACLVASTDLPLALPAADVAVHLPDGPETWAYPVAEAMGAGAAVVAADTEAVRELVARGSTAVLVTPGDPERLATALLAVHDDVQERRRMADAAHKVARERLDARVVTRQVESIYQRILEAR